MQVNQILPESVIALRQLVYQARPLATATENWRLRIGLVHAFAMRQA